MLNYDEALSDIQKLVSQSLLEITDLITILRAEEPIDWYFPILSIAYTADPEDFLDNTRFDEVPLTVFKERELLACKGCQITVGDIINEMQRNMNFIDAHSYEYYQLQQQLMQD